MTDPRYLRRTQEPVPEALEKRLLKYALVAGAGLLAAPAAQAGAIYTPANVWITLSQNNPYDLNIDNAGAAEFRFNVTRGSFMTSYFYQYNWGALRVSPLGAGGGVLGYKSYAKADALQQSVRIGPQASNWLAGNVKMGSRTSWGGQYGEWNNVTDRYLGLRFQIGGNTHYGWARLTVNVNSQAYYEANLTGYAYNNVAGADIHAGGGIPEPSTLGLLAGGILGLALWRRRKQKPE